ncbi:MAG TPA: hypothetical protein DEA43_03805, partial [Candidatus Moranbacteria bacterium]|nr:hypothetical protein [Candidatus Moranbacteria bacterium]
KIIYKSYAFRNISFLANGLPAGRQVGDSNSLSFWILSICPKACQIRNELFVARSEIERVLSFRSTSLENS